MKQLTPNIFLFLMIILFNVSPVQGMWFDVFPMYMGGIRFTYEDHVLWNKRTKELAQEKALDAKKYNQNNPLITLPEGILPYIVSYSLNNIDQNNAIQSLKKNMQHFMQLKSVCTHFDNLLTPYIIGEFCKEYDLDTKNAVFQESLKKQYYTPILSLSYAGADERINNQDHCTVKLLSKAVCDSNIEMLKILFKHHVDPNLKYGKPILFEARTVEIAQMFIDNGAKIVSDSNVLWEIIKNGYSSDCEYQAELIPLYLKHGIQAESLDPIDNSCLFHALAECWYIRNADNFLKKATILLEAMPNLINMLNKQNQTPLDIAQQKLKQYKEENWSKSEAIEKLIVLFKKHGGLTAQELEIKQATFDYNDPESIYHFIHIALERPDLIDRSRVIQALEISIEENEIYPNMGQALHRAASLGEDAVLAVMLAALGKWAKETLLSSYINIDFPRSLNGCSDLHIACKKGHFSTVEFLINAVGEQAPEYVCQGDLASHTPLMLALLHPKENIILIVQANIQASGKEVWQLLSAQNKHKQTALMLIAKNTSAKTAVRDLLILEELITAAGDHALEYLNMKDSRHKTAFDYAEKSAWNGYVFHFLQKKMLIECSLCFDKKMSDRFYSMNGCNIVDNVVSGCNYSFCKECLLEHIAVHLDEGSTLELKCPNINCAKKMHQSDVQAITRGNKQLYQRFNQIVFDEFILQNNALIKHCPTPNCTIIYSIEDLENAGRFKCPGCKQIYCSHCCVQHAAEMTCQEVYEHRQLVGNTNKEEIANQEWIAENTKPCPQCKTSIQKNGGCYYIFCKKCGHEFCWQCLQPHDHTMNHPCGLWEDDVQMNQANQQLAQQLGQEDEDEELNEQDEA